MYIYIVYTNLYVNNWWQWLTDNQTKHNNCDHVYTMGCRLCKKWGKFGPQLLTIYVNITWYLYMSVDIY